jgi:hypothetical protein
VNEACKNAAVSIFQISDLLEVLKIFSHFLLQLFNCVFEHFGAVFRSVLDPSSLLLSRLQANNYLLLRLLQSLSAVFFDLIIRQQLLLLHLDIRNLNHALELLNVATEF